MKKYTIQIEDLNNYFSQIDSKLNSVQVSGDSVEHLYLARLLIKKIYDSIKEEDEKVKEKEE